MEVIEEYILLKLKPLVLCPPSDIINQDNTLWIQLQTLQFLQPQHLEVPASKCNELVFQLACDELRKINSFFSPAAKLMCICKCADILFNYLIIERNEESLACAGADDFLPLFIYTVIKAKVPYLFFNVHFITSYRYVPWLVF
jgi:hypothetical protein